MNKKYKFKIGDIVKLDLKGFSEARKIIKVTHNSDKGFSGIILESNGRFNHGEINKTITHCWDYDVFKLSEDHMRLKKLERIFANEEII